MIRYLNHAIYWQYMMLISIVQHCLCSKFKKTWCYYDSMACWSWKVMYTQYKLGIVIHFSYLTVELKRRETVLVILVLISGITLSSIIVQLINLLLSSKNPSGLLSSLRIHPTLSELTKLWLWLCVTINLFVAVLIAHVHNALLSYSVKY